MKSDVSIAGGGQDERWVNVLTRPDEPEHHLPPMLLYRLLKISNLIRRPMFVKQSEHSEMSLTELCILITLGHMREAASHELCEAAGLHPMNVSRAVASLRRRGQLEERRDENNRRRKLLRLTAEGRRCHDELEPHAAGAAVYLFRGIDDAALRNFSQVIDQLTANVLSDA